MNVLLDPRRQFREAGGGPALTAHGQVTHVLRAAGSPAHLRELILRPEGAVEEDRFGTLHPLQQFRRQFACAGIVEGDASGSGIALFDSGVSSRYDLIYLVAGMVLTMSATPLPLH